MYKVKRFTNSKDEFSNEEYEDRIHKFVKGQKRAGKILGGTMGTGMGAAFGGSTFGAKGALIGAGIGAATGVGMSVGAHKLAGTDKRAKGVVDKYKSASPKERKEMTKWLREITGE